MCVTGRKIPKRFSICPDERRMNLLNGIGGDKKLRFITRPVLKSIVKVCVHNVHYDGCVV